MNRTDRVFIAMGIKIEKTVIIPDPIQALDLAEPVASYRILTEKLDQPKSTRHKKTWFEIIIQTLKQTSAYITSMDVDKEFTVIYYTSR